MFFFESLLAVLDSLCLYMNFRISLPISKKRPPGILIGIALDPWTVW